MRERIGDRLERAVESRAEADLELERRAAQEHDRPSLRRTLLWLAITGVSLYLVTPSVVEVFGSADELGRLDPAWLAVMAVLQGATLGCFWILQRIAVHTKRWRPVIASQLAGAALAKVAPGGGAVGAALQYRMLVQAGLERGRVAGGITAANLLTFAVVLALPVLTLPAIIRGRVPTDLVEATVAGLVVFAVLLALCVLALTRDGPLRLVGRVVQRARNAIRRGARPLATLPERLLRERDRILKTLGPTWRGALAATVGRWAFDYGILLAALAAVGATPRAALVLLAFCAAQLLAQVPLTPGGLGFVEAGLTGTLALAGVSAGDALLATLAYRLFTYWLPLPLGLVGLGLQRYELASGRAGAGTG